jgi:hypothetical protein
MKMYIDVVEVAVDSEASASDPMRFVDIAEAEAASILARRRTLPTEDINRNPRTSQKTAEGGQQS